MMYGKLGKNVKAPKLIPTLAIIIEINIGLYGPIFCNKRSPTRIINNKATILPNVNNPVSNAVKPLPT